MTLCKAVVELQYVVRGTRGGQKTFCFSKIKSSKNRYFLLPYMKTKQILAKAKMAGA